jgi:hypothetical protein
MHIICMSLAKEMGTGLIGMRRIILDDNKTDNSTIRIDIVIILRGSE